MEPDTLSNHSNKENQEKNNLNEAEKKEPFQKDKYKKKGEYPNFLLRLYQILENESYKNIIHWTEDGKYFVISNLHDFTEQILPKYYKHNNFSSFIRQLNMYDFHKKKSGQNEHIFHHQNFIKDRKDLLKLIKRKTKKENMNINYNGLIYNNGINNNYNNFKQIPLLDKKNNNDSQKNSLSIDDNGNTNNSINSLFSHNKNKFLPAPSNSNVNINNYNNDNINNINNNINNNDILNNYNFDIGKIPKVTKNNLQNLLNSLTEKIDIGIEKEKELEAKIESLTKQNEEFISQNQKILKEIISKSEYNKKLEAVICFIFELFKPKTNIKNKNNNNNINLIENNKNNYQGLVNFSSKRQDMNDINSKGSVLEPIQVFINKYFGNNKNNGIFPSKNDNNFINNDYNYIYKFDGNTIPNTDSNINKIKTLRRNLLCSGDNNKEEEKTSSPFINKKRKRSGSLSSILSEISKDSKVVYNNDAKNVEANDQKVEEEKIEEGKNVNNMFEMNDSFDSLNKSKNVFDLDFPQEENKSNNNDISQDLLSNSCTTFNNIYNTQI